MISNYLKKIATILIVFVVGIIVGYILLPTKVTVKEVKVVEYVKVNTKTKQVAVIKDGVTTITTDIDSKSDSTTKTDSYEKEEINVKKYDVLITYGRDLDNSANLIGGQFISEPFNKVLLGVGYMRNVTTTSNIVLVSAGFRI
jgi:hypothetical protein